MSDRELTYEEFCALPFEYVFGMHGDLYAVRLYRNIEYGLQRQLHTPRSNGEWGTGVWSYFLDRDAREFANVAEQYMAYMEKVCEVSND